MAADASAQRVPAADGATAAFWITAAWTGMGLVLWVLFPMTSAVLLPLSAIAPAAWYWAARRRLPLYPLSGAMAVLALAAGYLLINASWTPSLSSAASTVALAFVMVGVLQVVLHALPELEAPPLRAMALGAVAGFSVAAVLMGLEVFSDQSLRRHLMQLVPALQPSPKHLEIEPGQPARLASYLPNASIGVLTLTFWPVMLAASRLGLLHRWRLPAALAIVALAAIVFSSEHQTSQLAFAGAGAMFVLARLRPKLAMPALVAGWVAAHLAVVPVAYLLYSANAYRAPWLPESARQRIVIWRATAEQIPKAPLLGAGIGAARVVHVAQDATGVMAPGTQFHLSTGLHSHNAYLQVWYEAGAVGAAIMLGLGLTVLRTLRTFPVAVQPYLAAAFAGCALEAATAYSIWAPWFMASLAITALFAGLGAALPRAGPSGSDTVIAAGRAGSGRSA
jgi:hypothetical protein